MNSGEWIDLVDKQPPHGPNLTRTTCRLAHGRPKPALVAFASRSRTFFCARYEPFIGGFPQMIVFKPLWRPVLAAGFARSMKADFIG